MAMVVIRAANASVSFCISWRCFKARFEAMIRIINWRILEDWGMLHLRPSCSQTAGSTLSSSLCKMGSRMGFALCKHQVVAVEFVMLAVLLQTQKLD